MTPDPVITLLFDPLFFHNQFQANYEQASGLVEKAAARGVKMVFLPEAFDFIGESGAESLKLAQSLTGDTLRLGCINLFFGGGGRASIHPLRVLTISTQC